MKTLLIYFIVTGFVIARSTSSPSDLSDNEGDQNLEKGTNTNFFLQDLIENGERQKREVEVDPTFYRRYNRLRNLYKDRPGVWSFLKYFVRNRGQKRERRQIDPYSYPPYDSYNRNYNSIPRDAQVGIPQGAIQYQNPSYPIRQNIPQYQNAYTRYYSNQIQNQPPVQYYQNPAQQRVGFNNKKTTNQTRQRSTTSKPVKKRKPFRPPMVFF